MVLLVPDRVTRVSGGSLCHCSPLCAAPHPAVTPILLRLIQGNMCSLGPAFFQGGWSLAEAQQPDSFVADSWVLP